jgi:FtsP/CotA-like multicopper oxidase with cupredoxin domain
MMGYVWSIDGLTWDERRPLTVRHGQRVVIEMTNHSMMVHPMHLHGHHFQVIGLNGRGFSGATRDTVMVPPMGSIAIAFDADNPGRWLFHCHNLYHMAAGMMTEVVYTDMV